MGNMADGFGIALAAMARGVEPDPELWINQWAEEHMYLPKKHAAEHGKYRNERTPYARRVQECLSPAHPCKRVVVRAASQMLKTQAGLNWLAGSIDLAPANMLVLLPTLTLAKRVSARIADTIKEVPRLRNKVAAPRSRDARNTIDTKEFDGGTLHITTAGSASNLAEIAIRYGWGDEVDRWELDVDGEGDPVTLLDNRTGTYSSSCKQYFTSSPGIAEFSRIDKLVAEGTDEYYFVPCPHCQTLHTLEFENLQADEALTRAWMVCPHCAAVIEESAKASMLPEVGYGGQAEWRATRKGDGDTISFSINKLYDPLGWVSWLKLAKQRDKAVRAFEAGDSELLQVFRNTREAKSWSAGKQMALVEDLVLRGEDYREFTVPLGGLILTVGVDVQHDRLAISIWAWGREEEAWLVYWGEIPGDTIHAGLGAWADLEKFLFTEPSPGLLTQRSFAHACGGRVQWRRCTVDCGDGTTTQDAAYAFCRKHRSRGILSGKGGSERMQARLEIFTPPKTSVDTGAKDKASKYGLKPYIVGTHKAKDLLIEGRLPLCERGTDGSIQTGRGPGRLHWYKEVRADFHDQMLSEVKVPSRTKRGRKDWKKKSGVNNEALDTLVYAYHAARSLKVHLLSALHWDVLEQQLRQQPLLPPDNDAQLASDGGTDAGAAQAIDGPVAVPAEAVAAASPIPQAKPAAPAERDWLDDHTNWLD